MIIHGSLRHDHTGRKKKTTSKRSYKRVQSTGTFKPNYNYTRGRTDHIPSHDSKVCNTGVDPLQKEKLEVSKNYTVAVAYNKGAYQVIPKDAVKLIGK